MNNDDRFSGLSELQRVALGRLNLWVPYPWQADAFYLLFDHFNQRLFEGALPETGFAMGHLPAARGSFATRKDGSHYIALNHDTLRRRTRANVGATIVHEMVHLWRYVRPEPDRGPDHDDLWSSKMVDVGLLPHTHDRVAGTHIAKRLMETIVPDGPYDAAARDVPDDVYRDLFRLRREDCSS